MNSGASDTDADTRVRTAASQSAVSIDEIVNLCARRGFVFRSCEIYGEPRLL